MFPAVSPGVAEGEFGGGAGDGEVEDDNLLGRRDEAGVLEVVSDGAGHGDWVGGQDRCGSEGRAGVEGAAGGVGVFVPDDDAEDGGVGCGAGPGGDDLEPAAVGDDLGVHGAHLHGSEGCGGADVARAADRCESCDGGGFRGERADDADGFVAG